MWPDSQDRPPHDGDRMLATVSGATQADKALIVDSLSDVQLAAVVFSMLPAEVERMFWDRMLAAQPLCEGCGVKHWPGDPHGPKWKGQP
jgi:hypothetical protein